MEETNDNSQPVVTDNQTVVTAEPVAVAPETVQQDGQDNGQHSPTPETLGGLDPTKLPPDLRKYYDSMLSDYRSKTEKLSEQIKSEVAKSTESYKSKAELYEQIANQQEFVTRWNSYVKEANAKANGQGLPVEQRLEKELNDIKIKLQTTETMEFINSWADAKNEKGEALRPDLDKYESLAIEGTSDNLFALMVKNSQGKTPEERLQNGYQAAQKVYKAIFEEGRKAALNKVNERVRGSSIPPSRSGPSGSFAGDVTKLSVREARELAEKGIRLH